MIDEKDVPTTYFEDIAKQDTQKFETHPEIAAATPPIEQEAAEPTPQEVQQVAPEIPASRQNEAHVRALRLAKERAEKERDELAQQMREIYLKQQPQQQEAQPNPDDLVEWKYVSKEIKQLRDEIRSYQQVSSESAVEARLKTQYPDFDKVVSRENIEILRAEYPELAETLSSTNNLYSKGASAYTMIKRLGIVPEDQHQFQQDAARMKANNAKPRSSATIAPQRGESPLSQANAFSQGLTDDLKKQLQKEMADAMKNR